MEYTDGQAKNGEATTEIEWRNLAIQAGEVFQPAAPISDNALFAGRKHQLRRLADAINQTGRHAVVFGERGVGKTSLVRILAEALEHPARPIIIPRVNCDSADDYSTLWRKVFNGVSLQSSSQKPGFVSRSPNQTPIDLTQNLPKTLSSDDVGRVLSQLATLGLPVIVLDEFDRLEGEGARKMVADTIKMLSDHTIDATVVLVGVADSVTDLIEQHESVARAIVEIKMPRMSRAELHEIMEKGLGRLRMEIAIDARNYISALSQGLPEYTHSLALHATRAAIDDGRRHITMADVEIAITRSLQDAEHSIQSAYDDAVTSPKAHHLFQEVLISCALAEAGDLGYFSAADVRAPLRKITHKDYEIPSFARHLKEFCEPVRGPILQRTGQKHRVRYRFLRPLLQPYAIMKGIAAGLVDRSMVDALMASRDTLGV